MSLVLSLLFAIFRGAGFSAYGFDDFVMQLVDSRICWIRGALGYGKTSVAFMMGAFLLKLYPDDYYYLASNIPHKFPSPPLSNGVDNTVVVFDEAGAFLDSRDWQTNPRDFYLALRKLSAVVLAPSKNPPDKRLQELIVQRVGSVGTLAWFYSWRYQLGDDFREGKFMIYKPTAVFGFYSTGAYPPDDLGILPLFKVSMQKLKDKTSDWLAYSVKSDDPDLQAKNEKWASWLLTIKGKKNGR